MCWFCHFKAATAAQRDFFECLCALSAMLSCAELAKRIDSLEAFLKDNIDSLVKDLATKMLQKFEEQGVGEHVKLAETVGFVSDKYDSVLAQNAELVAANKELLARNAVLEKKVTELEQYSRLNNIEIKGIPTTKGEDRKAILQRVANVIECPISPDDIDTVHRVSTKSTGKNLIARFCSRDKKNEFVRKARKARLRASQLGFSGEIDQPVFVNDHLTMENKRLFAKALALKKEKKWQFLWTDNCQILARMNEDCKVNRIVTEADLRIFN